MVHSVSRWTRGVQVKLWDPLRTRAIPEHLRGAFTMRRYTNPRLPYLTLIVCTERSSSANTLCCKNFTSDTIGFWVSDGFWKKCRIPSDSESITSLLLKSTWVSVGDLGKWSLKHL